jgi:hypothetical protein
VPTAPSPAVVTSAVRHARARRALVGVPTEPRAVPTALAPTAQRRVSVPSAGSSAVAPASCAAQCNGPHFTGATDAAAPRAVCETTPAAQIDIVECGAGCDGASCAFQCVGKRCGAECTGASCAAECRGTECGANCKTAGGNSRCKDADGVNSFNCDCDDTNVYKNNCGCSGDATDTDSTGGGNAPLFPCTGCVVTTDGVSHAVRCFDLRGTPLTRPAQPPCTATNQACP